MERKICQVCHKRFTRQWNLERHVNDIHHISEYGENNMVKQKYEGPSYSYSPTIKNEQFRNSENNTTDMMYYENPPEYHNFTNHYSNQDLYNKRSYQNFEPIFNRQKGGQVNTTRYDKNTTGLTNFKKCSPTNLSVSCCYNTDFLVKLSLLY